MKKLVLTLLTVVVAIGVSAQSAQNSLAALRKAMPKGGNYSIRFAVEGEGMGASEGEVVMSGNRYRISVGSQSQFSDGRYCYQINGEDREVTIDNIDPSSRNLLSNPVAAFDFDESEFKAQLLESNEQVDVVALTPAKGVLDGVDRVVVYISKQSSLPTKMKYDFMGSQLSLDIGSIKRIDEPAQSLFQFDKNSYKGYEMIDMR